MPAGLPEASLANAVLDLLDLTDDPGAAVARLRGADLYSTVDAVNLLCPTADHTTRSALTSVLTQLGIASRLTCDEAAALADVLDFSLGISAVALSRVPPPPSRLAVTATSAPELTELREQLHLRPLVQLIEDVVRSATDVCVLGAPYWNSAALDRLWPALGGFARRGGRVEFICQGGPADAFDPLPALRRVGRDVCAAGGDASIWTFVARDHAGRWAQLHAKFALADGAYGYLGSANMTQQGFGHHFEIGVRLSSVEASELGDLLEHLKSGAFLIRD